jgi:hypothetical protein
MNDGTYMHRPRQLVAASAQAEAHDTAGFAAAIVHHLLHHELAAETADDTAGKHELWLV